MNVNISQFDPKAMKEYLALKEKEEFKIKLNLTHSVLIKVNMPEIRYDIRTPIFEIKKDVEYRYGSKPENVTLQLKDSEGVFVIEMNNMDETLQHYSAQNGFTIHVVDSDPEGALKDLDDLSKVQKYEISENDYEQRDNTFRKFKEKMIQENPNFMNAHQAQIVPDYQKAEASLISVESRCQHIVSKKRGQVKYVGKVPALGAGYWVGIVLDDPSGETDGSVSGTKYFECPDSFGTFIRPKDIEIGDFPPEEEFDMEEDMI